MKVMEKLKARKLKKLRPKRRLKKIQAWKLKQKNLSKKPNLCRIPMKKVKRKAAWPRCSKRQLLGSLKMKKRKTKKIKAKIAIKRSNWLGNFLRFHCWMLQLKKRKAVMWKKMPKLFKTPCLILELKLNWAKSKLVQLSRSIVFVRRWGLNSAVLPPSAATWRCVWLPGKFVLKLQFQAVPWWGLKCLTKKMPPSDCQSCCKPWNLKIENQTYCWPLAKMSVATIFLAI